MNAPRHLLLTGEVAIGKSTLVQKLLHENKPLFGFITKRLAPDQLGLSHAHIHATVENERVYSNPILYCVFTSV